MPDLMMIVDTALAEVPVNIMPLIDDGDFKTIEDSIAYNASGMDLVWNFTTVGGATTQTAVTPTTSGTYDWAAQGNGMYTIKIPASGGASINNDTEGFGWFSGVVTGVLPWRGPVIQFSPANIVNSLVVGSDRLDVGEVESLGTQAKADVNAEVVDCLNVDTYAQPGQATPAATASIVTKLGYLHKSWRNRTTQTATQYSLYNDDADTVDQKASFADNGTTADRGEVATGP